MGIYFESFHFIAANECTLFASHFFCICISNCVSIFKLVIFFLGQHMLPAPKSSSLNTY